MQRQRHASPDLAISGYCVKHGEYLRAWHISADNLEQDVEGQIMNGIVTIMFASLADKIACDKSQPVCVGSCMRP